MNMKLSAILFLTCLLFGCSRQAKEVSTVAGIPTDSLLTGKEFKIQDTVQKLVFNDGNQDWSLMKQEIVNVTMIFDTIRKPIESSSLTDTIIPISYWFIDTIRSADDPSIILAIDTSRFEQLEVPFSSLHRLSANELKASTNQMNERIEDQGFHASRSIMWISKDGQINSTKEVELMDLLDKADVIWVDYNLIKEDVSWGLHYFNLYLNPVFFD